MERDPAKASHAPESFAPAANASQVAAPVPTLGNQDAQRAAALQSNPLPIPEPASRAVTVHLDIDQPWIATVDGEPGDEAVAAELYGLEASVPIESFKTPAIPAYGIPARKTYIVDPKKLREPYRALYASLVNIKQTVLDLELESDFRQIVQWLDMGDMVYPMIEPKVYEILRKWGHVTFRPEPPWNPRHFGRSVYLDKLFMKLSMKSKDVGILATVWTSYYDMMFNHFSDTDELKRIRDEYSISFVGTGAIEEISFGGVLWDRVKSGEVRDNIFGYFKGLKDAGVGFFKGMYHMVRHPIDTIEGLGKLPQTLKTLWQNRSELLDQFMNASEEEKGRIIGRFFGEIEVLIATSGAGKAAGGLPKLPIPMPVLVPAEAVAVGRVAAGATELTVDLAKLGKAGAGLAMMSQALDKTSRGADVAEELRNAETRERTPVEKSVAQEEKAVDEASRAAAEGKEQFVVPTARGAAVEVALLEKLGITKLPNWFETLDGIVGGTYRRIEEVVNGARRIVHQYTNPKGFSMKSTWKTDFAEIETYIHDSVTALKEFKVAERTEAGRTVRVRGLSERNLEFVFDTAAKFENEAELITFMKRMVKNAKARGVTLRWWVDKEGSLIEGIKYFKDQAKLWADLD